MSRIAPGNSNRIYDQQSKLKEETKIKKAPIRIAITTITNLTKNLTDLVKKHILGIRLPVAGNTARTGVIARTMIAGNTETKSIGYAASILAIHMPGLNQQTETGQPQVTTRSKMVEMLESISLSITEAKAESGEEGYMDLVNDQLEIDNAIAALSITDPAQDTKMYTLGELQDMAAIPASNTSERNPLVAMEKPDISEGNYKSESSKLTKSSKFHTEGKSPSGIAEDRAKTRFIASSSVTEKSDTKSSSYAADILAALIPGLNQQTRIGQPQVTTKSKMVEALRNLSLSFYDAKAESGEEGYMDLVRDHLEIDNAIAALSITDPAQDTKMYTLGELQNMLRN